MVSSSAPPPPGFLLVELKKKAPPPSEESPPASESPPPDQLSPPPPPPNGDVLTPPPSENSPPPPDVKTPPPVSSSPPPPPPPPVETSPPPLPPDNSSPPPVSDKSPPPPSPKAPPPDTSSPPPPSPPPPTKVSPPPPPPVQDSPPPPPHNKHSPPPTAPPPLPNNDTPPPPPNDQTPPPPPNNQTPPPPPPTDQSPPPSFPPPPPPTTNAPPPSNNSALTPPPDHQQPSPASPPSNSSNKGTPPAASPLPVTNKKTVTDQTPSTKTQANGAHTVFVSSLVGLCALSLLVLAVWFLNKRRRRRTKQIGLDIYRLPSQFSSSHNSESSFLKPPRPLNGSQSHSGSEFMFPDESSNSTTSVTNSGIGSSRSWFTYQELSDATDRFSSNNLLGEGGFGCVYKGRLSDGKIVAVKQLKVGSGQGEREFRAEVDIISRIHHRHLVSLVGYCISDRQRLLVYEYIANDTLENHLHAQAGPVLSWTNRVKIAIGSARGLAYLHEDCHPRIIHRDIKSANILLDENFESRVADFGLARLASDTYTHVSTRVMGTFGYMAPEYASSGKLTEKSDVYSFGVVLLELITGRKPVDLSQDESLVEWARPLLIQALETENFTELADPRLENNYIDAEMFRMIEAAGACVRHSASKRPKMGQVVRAFDSMGELADLTNGVKPGQSGIFNTAEQSAQMRMFQKMAFGSQDYSNGFFNETQSSWSSDSNSLASRSGPRL